MLLRVGLGLALASAALASLPARVVVTAHGRVGPLHVDTSTRADVIAFAGAPGSEVRSRYGDYPPFDALGYGCHGHRASWPSSPGLCETIFYLDARSDRLAIMWTHDPRYADLLGIHVGTRTAVAERDLHLRVVEGCLAQLQLAGGDDAFIAFLFAGGRDRTVRRGRETYLHLVGGHVDTVVVHSLRLNPGVLDCIDS